MCDSDGGRGRRRQELRFIYSDGSWNVLLSTTRCIFKMKLFFLVSPKKMPNNVFSKRFSRCEWRKKDGSAIINLRFMQRRHISGFVDHFSHLLMELADFESNQDSPRLSRQVASHVAPPISPMHSFLFYVFRLTRTFPESSLKLLLIASEKRQDRNFASL